MKLSTQDAELFTKLMWSLLAYANLKLKLIPGIATLDDFQMLPLEQQLSLRNALYDHIELIDTYLEEIPQYFSEEELDIIKSWKKFVRGDFFIERTLKKHAIFIGGEKVYAVLGLYSSLEEVLPHVRWPYYAKTVLLPFKGKIIYDGLLQGYNLSFGTGIRADLREFYLAAKQNGRIITSLEQVEKKLPAWKASKNLKSALDEISRQAKKLRSSKDAPAMLAPGFRLVKSSLEFSRLAIEQPDDLEDLWRALSKVKRAIQKAESVLHRAEIGQPK